MKLTFKKSAFFKGCFFLCFLSITLLLNQQFREVKLEKETIQVEHLDADGELSLARFRNLTKSSSLGNVFSQTTRYVILAGVDLSEDWIQFGSPIMFASMLYSSWRHSVSHYFEDTAAKEEVIKVDLLVYCGVTACPLLPDNCIKLTDPQFVNGFESPVCFYRLISSVLKRSVSLAKLSLSF